MTCPRLPYSDLPPLSRVESGRPTLHLPSEFDLPYSDLPYTARPYRVESAYPIVAYPIVTSTASDPPGAAAAVPTYPTATYPTLHDRAMSNRLTLHLPSELDLPYTDLPLLIPSRAEPAYPAPPSPRVRPTYPIPPHPQRPAPPAPKSGRPTLYHPGRRRRRAPTDFPLRHPLYPPAVRGES